MTGVGGRRLLRRSADLALLLVVVGGAWYLWPARFGGSTSVIVVGGRSMEPTYQVGDVVLTRAGAPSIGDVVVFDPPLESPTRPLVLHRIVGGSPQGWITRGDGNPHTDPWVPTSDDVVGIARWHLPGGARLLRLASAPWFFGTLAGVAAVAVLWPRRPAAPGEDGDDPEADDDTDPPPADHPGTRARSFSGISVIVSTTLVTGLLTAGSAASLAVSADDLAAVVLPGDRCDSEVTVEPGHSSGDLFSYDLLVVAAVDPACVGRTAQIAVRDHQALEVASGQAVVTGSSFSVPVAPAVASSTFGGVAFAVDGWGIPAVPASGRTSTHVSLYDDTGTHYCAEVTVTTTSPVPVTWTSVVDLSTYPLDGEPQDVWWHVDFEWTPPLLTATGYGEQQHVAMGDPVVWGFCAARTTPPPPSDEVTYTIDYQYNDGVPVDWVTGYCAVVTVSTDSPTPITWVTDVVLDEPPFDGTPDQYSNVTHDGFDGQTILAARGVGWNSQIQAGTTAEFGYCALRTPGPPDPDVASYRIDFQMQNGQPNDWGTGYCAVVTVTTASPTNVTWVVAVDLSTYPFNGTPGGSGTAQTSFDRPILTASGPPWNPYISLGSPAVFEFCATRP